MEVIKSYRSIRGVFNRIGIGVAFYDQLQKILNSVQLKSIVTYVEKLKQIETTNFVNRKQKMQLFHSSQKGAT